MKNNAKVKLMFDKYYLYVSYDSLKQLIINELNRLAKETGYGIEHLKIEFKENHKDNVIAFFHSRGDKAEGFCFHLNKFNDTTANKVIDTCRHEFAHYVVFMSNKNRVAPHGKEWKSVCKKLGANPSPKMDASRTKHIISSFT